MGRMLKPVHPGRIIRDDYMEPLELTMGRLASALGVTRQTMVKIVNEKAGVSPEMALRLSEAFDTTPDLWLTMQKNYDLRVAREKFTPARVVKKLFVNTVL